MKTLLLTTLTFTTITLTHASTTPITLNFQAIAQKTDGTTAIANCTDTYQFGTQNTPATLADLRFYVSNVKVLTKQGNWLTVNLTPNAHQQSDVALIDLEDGTANCQARGSQSVNATLMGNVVGKYSSRNLVGVSFEIGVPNVKNHSLYSSELAPLDLQAMSWAWLSGRKFLKIELNVPQKVKNLSDGTTAPLYNVHFGRTGCTGEPATGNVSCTKDNRIIVNLQGRQWQTSPITLDLNALFARSDISQNHTGAVGCMSAETDKDCVGVFATAGLSGESQRIFGFDK